MESDLNIFNLSEELLLDFEPGLTEKVTQRLGKYIVADDVQIVDAASGDWGHINVAQIVQTDAPERLPVATGPLYHEALRPQFHFTARQWTMDRLNPAHRWVR